MHCEMEAQLREIEGKTAQDPYFGRGESVTVPFPVIIGAGPSGLAAAACLKAKGVPSVVLERSNCIASLWQLKTYDRLKLHLPKKFCELPMMPFPSDFPNFPTKHQFIKYLEAYAAAFEIRLVFNRTVVSAEFDGDLGLWRVRTAAAAVAAEYRTRWVIVATGENAEEVVPEIEGLGEFKGGVMHTCRYRSGALYEGKKVLVVGCGNSGMEVCLDLCNHNAMPSLVVRDTVHILPQVMTFGISTFGLSMWLLKWLPVRLVDRFLLAASWFILGDTSKYGLNRPDQGPLERKNMTGKTPVLDVGTLEKIRNGHIKVRPSIKRLRQQSVEFTDGTSEHFDVIILATGYKSNVPSWLKNSNMFSDKNGLPKRPFPNGWKGEDGLYAVGFTRRGLLGASIDANNIANDIASCWDDQKKKRNGIPSK